MSKLRNLATVALLALPSLTVLAEGSAPSVDLSQATTYGTAVKTAVTTFISGTYLEVLGSIAIGFLAVRYLLLIIHRAGRAR